MSSWFRRWPLHLFVAAVYPVLALLANNISQVKASAALRPLLIVVCTALLLWGLLLLVLRDVRRSALLASWWLVLFFAYGHVYNFLEAHTALGRHRLLLPLWVLLALAGTWLILRKVKDLGYVTLVVNTIGLVLLVFPLLQLGAYAYRSRTVASNPGHLPPELASLQVPPGETPPDVYYIILDAYSRADVLKSFFGYDNAEFLDYLRQKGFYVADCSQSNYAKTELSLSTSLNMDYLDDLLGQLDSTSQDRVPVDGLLDRNTVRRAFKNMGYSFVSFETGFLFTQFEDADVYLYPGRLGGLSGFEVLLVKTTGGLALVDAAAKLPKFFEEGLNTPERIRHTQVSYTLDQLAKVPARVPGPKFVFAHVVAPHEPLVFSSDGSLVHYPEPLDVATFKLGYSAEVTYLNHRVMAVLDRILSDSTTPPIIIIQGDHGHDLASPDDRMDILNAYYLPGGGESLLYPTITPVNSFRVVFDRYFGGNLDLLKDRSFFSYYQKPFDYKYVPNLCQ
jgi:hypothetical protein